jgi:hypothetical protein
MNSPLLSESANYTVILKHKKKDKLFIYIVLELFCCSFKLFNSLSIFLIVSYHKSLNKIVIWYKF